MVSIPILDIYAIGCGVYMGYAHKNGVEINYDFYAFSPIVASIGSTYVGLKFLDYVYSKFDWKKFSNLNLDSVEFKDTNGCEIDFEKISLEDRIDFGKKYDEQMGKIKESFSFREKSKLYFQNTSKTSFEIGVGYLIGRALF